MTQEKMSHDTDSDARKNPYEDAYKMVHVMLRKKSLTLRNMSQLSICYVAFFALCLTSEYPHGQVFLNWNFSACQMLYGTLLR